MKMFILLLCCTLALALNPQTNVNPQVKLSSGIFQGSIMQSRLGRKILSFRGIRYAEIATRRNRFKEATPIKSYNGVYDATKDGPSCPQPAHDNRVISEDCLHLNVFTTALPEQSSDNTWTNSDNLSPNRDVVVFIHPGDFDSYSGTTHDFGPQILLDKDIVLVTFNYRLGALGFLSTGDARAPGNAGLKDQVLVLRWIQKYIRNFGGNPDSVTLLGNGAGAQSVTLHIVSPLSKGLFHKAIAMSGSITNQNRLPHHQQALAKRQAEVLRCPTININSMLECLYEKTPEEIGNSLPKLTEFHGNPVSIYSPVVEHTSVESSKNNEGFLPAQPIDIIRQRKANFVPLITGVNKDELGSLVIMAEEQAQQGNPTIYNQLNNKWEQLAPILFNYERNSSRSVTISNELKSYYLKDDPVHSGNYAGLAKLYADLLVIFQVYRLERLMANYSSEPVYQYHYKYQGCQSFVKWSNGSKFGIVHEDELLLLFKIGNYPAPCDKDIRTIERLTGMFATFAKTGRPIPTENSNVFNVDWKPSTQNNPMHLDIADDLDLEKGSIYQDRMNKLEVLFPWIPADEIQDNSWNTIRHDHIMTHPMNQEDDYHTYTYHGYKDHHDSMHDRYAL